MQVITPMGHTIKYTLTDDGTAYHAETSPELVNVLENARKWRTRVRLILGDPKTGEKWGDVETGYIGRSGGRIKVPLVICNANSLGGGALLDHCIVAVEHANKKNGGIIWSATA